MNTPYSYLREIKDIASQVMAEKNLTQRQLADILGVTESAVSRWLNMERTAARPLVERMREMLRESAPPQAQKDSPPIVSIPAGANTNVVVKIDGAYNINNANTKVEIHVNGVVIWITRNP